MIDALMPNYARAPLAFVKGEGPYLETAEGRKYLDFAAGVGVNSLGHGHPACVATMKAQADAVWHVSNLYRIPELERLAARLVEKTFADTAFFCNSGAEAIECAIKTARRFHAKEGRPERFRIITMEGAFHGRTLATIAAGGQEKHLDGFGPKVDGFDQVPLGDLAALKAAIGPETAAIMLEPIQGEGGLRPVPDSYLEAVRALCDEYGLLFILDEVQCGNGRTGKPFAYQHTSITPDILSTAKGLANGFPIGACLATEQAGKHMTAGSHGSTFGGNPMAAAIANTVLDVMEEPGFLENVSRQGETLLAEIEGIKAQVPGVIEGVRGRGLMIGMKMSVPAGDMVAELQNQGLLTVAAGDNVVRLLPPLIVNDEHVSEALDKIAAAARALAAKGTE